MKLSRHNGRSGKNGTYNVKHNDRRFDVEKSEHIDAERTKQNVYWDMYQGYYSDDMLPENEEMTASFSEVERRFYHERYFDFCEKQNARNERTRHQERNRSPDDLLKDKRTCPEESIMQIGNMDMSIPPQVFRDIAEEYFEEFNRRFGDHIHILDWSLHLDEATPHIHERHVFDSENRYGEIAPQQERTLEALNIPLPDPEKPKGKLNNRKITFDKICRTLLLDISKKHGLNLDVEPEYGGREYLEKQDYILMKQQEKIEKQDELIEKKEARLEHLEVTIADTEAFAEKVSNIAYEKAVEVVTERVVEETHNEDFKIIENYKKSIISPENPNRPDVKKMAEQVIDGLMVKFRGFTKKITEKLSGILRSPEERERNKEPIKRSIIQELQDAKKRSEAEREARKNNPELQRLKPKRKDDIER
ncbi:MAG: serine/arginine repetitive matrix protein 2 [Lachnospiraceae bacterium]|nr:serine/arginine repetitive matrix protein 2 [Lachnospiraceae bacterium]